jgi:hypothetical protein
MLGETAFEEVDLKIKILTAVALLSVACVNAWANDDEARYNQRAAQTDMSLFREMDRAGNGLLTKDDVRGDMRLGTRFDDIDTNRDEVVTPQEMRAYIEKTYGVLPAPGQGSRSKGGAGLISLVPCPLSIDPMFSSSLHHFAAGTFIPFFTAGRAEIASNQRLTPEKSPRSVLCHSWRATHG